MDEKPKYPWKKYEYYDPAFEAGMRYALLVVRKKKNLGIDKMLQIGFYTLDSYKKLKDKVSSSSLDTIIPKENG